MDRLIENLRVDCLRLMCQIKDNHGENKMFHELYPDLQVKWEESNNEKNRTKLIYLYNKMCKIVDEQGKEDV